MKTGGFKHCIVFKGKFLFSSKMKKSCLFRVEIMARIALQTSRVIGCRRIQEF